MTAVTQFFFTQELTYNPFIVVHQTTTLPIHTSTHTAHNVLYILNIKYKNTPKQYFTKHRKWHWKYDPKTSNSLLMKCTVDHVKIPIFLHNTLTNYSVSRMFRLIHVMLKIRQPQNKCNAKKMFTRKTETETWEKRSTNMPLWPSSPRALVPSESDRL